MTSCKGHWCLGLQFIFGCGSRAPQGASRSQQIWLQRRSFPRGSKVAFGRSGKATHQGISWCAFASGLLRAGCSLDLCTMGLCKAEGPAAVECLEKFPKATRWGTKRAHIWKLLRVMLDQGTFSITKALSNSPWRQHRIHPRISHFFFCTARSASESKVAYLQVTRATRSDWQRWPTPHSWCF